ncbi:zeta toxin family protein, partial [Runella limosa]|uniref:zeta toxin family protein n=1 Tax=Runella limosa TaxID=370978 RepID=UPI00048C060B
KKYVKILPDRIYEERKFIDTFSLTEEVSRRMEEAIAKGKNIVFEHNLHTTSVLNRLQKAKKSGYETSIHFLGVERIETQRNRVDARVLTGKGHDVDSTTIRERRDKGFTTIKTNLRVSDVTLIIDNSSKKPSVNLHFNEGILVEKKANLAEWVKKEFEVALKLQERLGVRPKESDSIKIKL